MKKIFLLLFAFFMLIGITCNGDNNIAGRGTIVHFDFEGGFYGIVADNGGHYLPENLSTGFQQDSLRVYFEGVLTNKVTIQQWGSTIRLIKIEKIQ